MCLWKRKASDEIYYVLRVFGETEGVVLPEYGEVYRAIGPMVYKAWMLGEVVLLTVFENEDASITKESRRRFLTLRNNDVGNLREFLKGVGRVSKDKVVLLSAGFQKAEHIATDKCATLLLKFLYTLTDKRSVVTV